MINLAFKTTAIALLSTLALGAMALPSIAENDAIDDAISSARAVSITEKLLRDDGNQYAIIPTEKKIIHMRQTCNSLNKGISLNQLDEFAVNESIRLGNFQFAKYFATMSVGAIYAVCPEHKWQLRDR